MKINKFQILPASAKILAEFAGNIKLARLQRKVSAEQVAERANICCPTLLSIENGMPGVDFGSYA